MKSKRYPNLYKYDTSPFWVFRKYSKEKRKEFVKSTKVEKDEARAYKVGIEAFNDWLGVHLPDGGRELLIKDYARAVLSAKESRKGNTLASARTQILNHIIPAFGHLRPDQITPMRWDQYDSQERRRVYTRRFKDHSVEYKRKALANTRKLLLDCLHRAYEHGAIRRVPKFKNHDPKPAPPRYIKKATMLKLINRAHRSSKLWMFIMWKQGARPGEILQYRWDLIRWEEGAIDIPATITKTGRARLIPLNPKVRRVLTWLYARSHSDWIFPSPSDESRPMKGYKSGWGTACKRVGVDFDPYNVRDTFITDRLKQGLSSTFIGRYCDNSPAMIDSRYAVAEQDVLARVAGVGEKNNQINGGGEIRRDPVE